ncbi:MAG: TolC family protein, partial [Candidatus Omnitrophica bacterium]|nr:TolC family protein [Candidatus Omnitrophota bacterium]
HEIRREIQVSDEKELSRNRSYQLQELRILEDFCSGMEKDLPVLIGSLAKEASGKEAAFREGWITYDELSLVRKELVTYDLFLSDVKALHDETLLKITKISGFVPETAPAKVTAEAETRAVLQEEIRAAEKNAEKQGGTLYRARALEEYDKAAMDFAAEKAEDSWFLSKWRRHKDDIDAVLEARAEGSRYSFGVERAGLLEAIAGARLTYMIARESYQMALDEENMLKQEAGGIKKILEGSPGKLESFQAEVTAAEIRRIAAESELKKAGVRLRFVLGHGPDEGAEFGKQPAAVDRGMIDRYLGSGAFNDMDSRLPIRALEESRNEYEALLDLARAANAKKVGSMLATLGTLDENDYYRSRIEIGGGFDIFTRKKVLVKYLTNRIAAIDARLKKEKEEISVNKQRNENVLAHAERSIATAGEALEAARIEFDLLRKEPAVDPMRLMGALSVRRQAEKDFVEAKRAYASAGIEAKKTSEVEPYEVKEERAKEVSPEERVTERAAMRVPQDKLAGLDKLIYRIRTGVPQRFTMFIGPSLGFIEMETDGTPGVLTVDPNTGGQHTSGGTKDSSEWELKPSLNAGLILNIYNIYTSRLNGMAEHLGRQKGILAEVQAMKDHQELVAAVRDVDAVEMKIAHLDRNIKRWEDDKSSEKFQKHDAGAGAVNKADVLIRDTHLKISVLERELAAKKAALEKLLGANWVIGLPNPDKGTATVYSLKDLSKDETAQIADLVRDNIISKDPRMRLFQEEMQKDLIDISRASLKRLDPSLNVSGVASLMESGDPAFSVPLNFSVILWDFGRSEAEKTVAELRKALTAARSRAEADSIIREIEQLARDIRSNYEKAVSAYAHMQSLRDSVSAARDEYNRGRSDYWVYVSQAPALQAAEMDFIGAVSEQYILVEQLKAYRDHFGAGIPEKTEETLIEQPGREDLRGYVRVEERDVTVPE